MSRRAAVIDTNVVVAGLLTSQPESPTVAILDAMLAASCPFLLSLELLAEYRRVLLRGPIREMHRLEDDEVDRILTEIALNGVVVEPRPAEASPPDIDDQHLWDLLAARPGTVLVTGDAELLEDPPGGVPALSPRGFVELALTRR